MSEQTSILVCGTDEIASAVARRLFVEGHTVVIHQSRQPATLRRTMSYADAWFEGAATLDGLEARRADVNAEFYLALGTRTFIPVLTHPFVDVVGRWPWDVVIASRKGDEPFAGRLKSLADLTIGLGTGFTADVDCTIVVDTGGPDYGAVLRVGSLTGSRRASADEGEIITACAAGLFRPSKGIGALVAQGECMATIDDTLVTASVAGRIRGLARHGQAVTAGTTVADVARSRTAQVAGIQPRHQLVSRGVAFAIEMALGGWEPVALCDRLER